MVRVGMGDEDIFDIRKLEPRLLQLGKDPVPAAGVYKQEGTSAAVKCEAGIVASSRMGIARAEHDDMVLSPDVLSLFLHTDNPIIQYTVSHL